MKLYEFVNKYINTKIDYDKYAGFQCVDVFRQYCADVLRLPHTGAVDGAKDLWLDYDKMPLEQKYFEQVTTASVKYGDALIWDATASNGYGHVAILLGWIDENNFLVFEQNGFAQDGAKVKVRNRENLLGGLRKKDV